MRDPHAPGPIIYLSLIVDSGANVSLLAKEHLRKLGIRQRGAQAEIERDRAPALGAKSRFAAWHSKVPLRAQVVLPFAPDSTPYPPPTGRRGDRPSSSIRDSRATHQTWPAAETSSGTSS
jgi:hypothetical protein